MNRRSLTDLLLFTLAAPALDPDIRLIESDYAKELRSQDQPARYHGTLGTFQANQQMQLHYQFQEPTINATGVQPQIDCAPASQAAQ